MIVILAIIILLLFLGYVGWKLSSVVIKPNRPTVEDTLKAEIEKNYISESWYKYQNKEKIIIKSKQGYDIDCEIIKSNKKENKVVILCHGYCSNRVGSMKYAEIFLEEGFDVIIYDHRACGYSGGDYTTMGYYESKDLSTIVDWVYKNYGEQCFIGTHGESMGAATVLMHCTVDPRINFVIADCGFSDLKQQLAYRLKVEYKLPSFPFLYIASFFAKIRANFWFKDVSPIKELQKKEGLPDIPILFIHGDDDDYILMDMCKEMYDVKKGKKALYIARGARHALSYQTDREEYKKQVQQFLS